MPLLTLLSDLWERLSTGSKKASARAEVKPVRSNENSVELPPARFKEYGVSESSLNSKESSGEVECRRVAEKLTGKEFPKKRPDFLRNSVTGANLEIDCFCEELKVGIEYNGAQHYRYTPYFHSSKEAFYNTKYRDDMKARLCAENGVKLIVVPYTVAVKDIEEYLRTRL